MQAIRTRVIPATNTKPRRIQAKCAARTIYICADHYDRHDDAHIAARETLLDVMKWRGQHYAPMLAGWFNGDCYHVFQDSTP